MMGFLSLLTILSPCLSTLIFLCLKNEKIRKKAMFVVLSVLLGYASLVAIPFAILMVSYLFHGNGAAEIGALYIIISWPALVVSSLLSSYFAYRKAV